MTRRLYHEDANLLTFEARVLRHQSGGLVLDASAFYPESGGQLADTGTLAGSAVRDVQLQDGEVVHLLEGTLPPVGGSVRGQVDGPRRRLHRSLHTGQHLFSRALLNVLGIGTASARLGERSCTIDLGDLDVSAEGVQEAVERVNQVIEDDRPVRAWFPTAAELSQLPLRRSVQVSGPIRVVSVEGFDVTPCGGTHCARTSQVGWLRWNGSERVKGKTRLHFSAGRRSLEEWQADTRRVRRLSAAFTCGPEGVESATQRLRQTLSTTETALRRAQSRWVEQLATDLLQAGDDMICCVLQEVPVELLRAVAQRLVAEGHVALLATGVSDGLHVVVSSPGSQKLDCGAFLGIAAKRAGGRGGGRGTSAEGRLPALTLWRPLVEEVLAEVQDLSAP